MRLAIHRVRLSLIVLFLTLIAGIAIYPLIFMGLNSFRTSIEYILDPLGLPTTFRDLENYQAVAIRFNIQRLFLNTVLYIVLASMISMIVSIPASFAFAKLRFPFRGGLRIILIATLIVPAITFIVPSYVMMADLGLINTFIPVVLFWAATSVPGNVFLLSSLMRAIPNEVLEAAKLDGAHYLETMRRVVVPLSAPGILTVTIFNVTAWWNDLLIPLIFLPTRDQMTVTVAVATIFSRHSSDYPMLLTGLLLASLPPIITYILLQGYIRRGLVIGSVR